MQPCARKRHTRTDWRALRKETPVREPPSPDEEIERLTEAGRRRTAVARATYREQVKTEALHLEAIRASERAEARGLRGLALTGYVDYHMRSLSTVDIDALTNARMRAIMAERGRASALSRRTARLERLYARRQARRTTE